MKTPAWIVALLAAVLGIGEWAGSSELRGQQQSGRSTWVTAWSTSLQGLDTTGVTDATLRLIVRSGLSGSQVRIRLSNAFGPRPLVIQKTYVGWRKRGAEVVAGSNTPVLFAGSPTVTIPAGASVQSDPVALSVLANQDLAVSLYMPERDVRPSEHDMALTTSYRTDNGAGDAAAEPGAARFTAVTTSMFWLKAIDVLAAPSASAVVALGDSITDGFCAPVDGHQTWHEWLAVRLRLEARRDIAVLNEGINANTSTNFQPPPNSPSVIDRMDRDVLQHAGVRSVILFSGTNDIRRGATPSQLMDGTKNVISRAKAKGLKVYGVTIIPRHVTVGGNPATAWTAEHNQVRRTVNQWIRDSAPFDVVFDFDRVVRDPARPDFLLPSSNCDDVHPTPRGYFEMAASMRLEPFIRR